MSEDKATQERVSKSIATTLLGKWIFDPERSFEPDGEDSIVDVRLFKEESGQIYDIQYVRAVANQEMDIQRPAVAQLIIQDLMKTLNDEGAKLIISVNFCGKLVKSEVPTIAEAMDWFVHDQINAIDDQPDGLILDLDAREWSKLAPHVSAISIRQDQKLSQSIAMFSWAPTGHDFTVPGDDQAALAAIEKKNQTRKPEERHKTTLVVCFNDGPFNSTIYLNEVTGNKSVIESDFRNIWIANRTWDESPDLIRVK